MKLEEALNKDGYLVYTNVGTSMLPLIREGKDLVYIKKTTESLKFFEVVLFKRPYIQGRGKYVLHRILKVNKNHTYFIMGDNDLKGEIVKEENILGILVSIKRGDKEIECNELSYKLIIIFWYFIFPLRFIYRVFRKIIRIIIK